MADWQALYAPLVGLPVEAIVFEPISADTWRLVDEMERASVRFSGAVQIVFPEGRTARLSWELGPRGLGPANQLGLPEVHKLDRVAARWAFPWDRILRKRLASVELFAFDGQISGIRHAFEGGAFMWIATTDAALSQNGQPVVIEPMDDLWISVSQDPTNLSDGALVARLGANSSQGR